MFPVDAFGEPIEAIALARIAYRMIARQYRYLKYDPRRAPAFIGMLSRWAGEARLGRLDLVLAAYAFQAHRGLGVRFIRATIISRAEQGYNFRQCLLWTYKAPWADDPPVSNTGVIVSRTDKGGNAL